MKRQNLAYIYALTAVFFWSTVATAFKISLRYVDHLKLLFYASVVSTIILFIILIIQKKIHLFRRYSKKDYLRSAALGFLNPFLYYVVLFKAYDILLAQEAQTLNYVWPLTLVLLSIPILRQKIKGKDILAVFVSFVGVIVIGTRGEFTSLNEPLGVGLAVGSSLVWALFWIYNMKDKRDESSKLFLNFLFGSIFAFVAVVLFSEHGETGINGVMGVSYVGIFEMGITFVLWLKALQLSENTAKVGNLIYLSPFISFILLYNVLGERILYTTIIGFVLVIVGIAIQKFSLRKKGDDEGGEVK